jgi:hypothetical protein
MPQKILVEVLDASGIKKRKKCIVQGSSVVIQQKKGRGRSYTPAFQAKFDESCLIFYRGMWPFRFLKRKLMVFDGHTKCISFNADTKIMEPSQYDVAELFDAEVLKKSGSLKTKLDVPFMLYLILIFILLMNVVSILVFTGRLRV